MRCWRWWSNATPWWHSWRSRGSGRRRRTKIWKLSCSPRASTSIGPKGRRNVEGNWLLSAPGGNPIEPRNDLLLFPPVEGISGVGNWTQRKSIFLTYSVDTWVYIVTLFLRKQSGQRFPVALGDEERRARPRCRNLQQSTCRALSLKARPGAGQVLKLSVTFNVLTAMSLCSPTRITCVAVKWKLERARVGVEERESGTNAADVLMQLLGCTVFYPVNLGRMFS